MPSGAKKRKAAKKKKGTQPNNNPNPSLASTQEGGDVKHQDDRQSDVGEASSTASQDHQSHHDLLTEGEEEKIENRENTSDLPRSEGVKIEGDEGNGVSVEREFKNGDEFGGKFEHDETERKSYDGGSSGSSSSSSSSSSSDDESQGVKSSHAVVEAAQVSAKVDHSQHEEYFEAEPIITIGEASDAVVDSTPPVVSDKVSQLSEGVEVDTSSPAKGSVAPSAVESVLKEDAETESFKDALPQLEEASTPSAENVAATSDPKACGAEETDERLSLSYNAPTATHDNGADFEKDSGVTEPLLVPPPRPAQTTSWKGCCGLFELFTGSDR